MWLKNALKITVVLSLIVGVPAFAKKQVQKPVLKNVAILATSYLVKDIDTGEIIAEQNSQEIRSIASITKLMSAVVVLDSGANLSEMLDVYPIKGIGSRLQKTKMSRSDLLTLSLMSSDNLAAKILAINHPGGEDEHVASMNKKAEQLGMVWSKFVDPTGLYNENVSTGEDLVKLVLAAENYQFIKTASTSVQKRIEISAKKKSRYIDFHTTNHLINKMPEIVLSKTGWIRKSGGCLVMSIHEHGRRLAVILLNSKNTHTRFRDAELLYGLHHGKNI
jgi:D-alanyl-D-alanine endopeptidase (penicillin-binding protein 7)